MRRPRRKLEVNTFPFLAVLLCAMGSFILLLLMIDKQGKIVAQNKAKDDYLARKLAFEASREAALKDAKDQEAKHKAAWQMQKDKIHAELKSEEDALARQMTQLLAALSKADEKLTGEKSATTTTAERIAIEDAALNSLRKELASRQDHLARTRQTTQGHLKVREQLTRDIAVLEAALRNVQDRKTSQRPVYSLVPYKGKHGASAKPIYIEVNDGVATIHPGPTTLTAATWSPEALRRAIEERTGPLEKEVFRPGVLTPKETNNPYVLFLMRPSGIPLYYESQHALRGYRVDFGYELVEPDWVFDFSDGKLDQQPWRNVARVDVEPSNVTRPAPKGMGPRVLSPFPNAGDLPNPGERGASAPRGGASQDGPSNPFNGSQAGVPGEPSMGGVPGQPGFGPPNIGAPRLGGPGPGIGGSGFGPAGGLASRPANPNDPPGLSVFGQPNGNQYGQTGGSGNPAAGSPGGVPGGIHTLPGMNVGGQPGIPGASPTGPGAVQLPPGATGGPLAGQGAYGGVPGISGGPPGVPVGSPTGPGGVPLQPGTTGSPIASQGAYGGVPGAPGGQPQSGGGAPNMNGAGGQSFPGSNGSPGQVNDGPPRGSAQPGTYPPGTVPSGPYAGQGGVPGGGPPGGASGGGGGNGRGDPRAGFNPSGGSGSGAPGVAGNGNGVGDPNQSNPGQVGSQPQAGGPSSQGAAGNPAGQGGIPSLTLNLNDRKPDQPSAPRRDSPSDSPLSFRNVPPEKSASAEPGEPGNAPPPAFAGNGGNPGGDPGPRLGPSPFVPLEKSRPGPRLPALGRIVSNRDFVLTVECFERTVSLSPPGRTFDANDPRAIEELAALMKTLVTRRQGTVRPGEPPYRPIVHFRVQPDGRRTYYDVYPRIAEFGYPMSRENPD